MSERVSEWMGVVGCSSRLRDELVSICFVCLRRNLHHDSPPPSSEVSNTCECASMHLFMHTCAMYPHITFVCTDITMVSACRPQPRANRNPRLVAPAMVGLTITLITSLHPFLEPPSVVDAGEFASWSQRQFRARVKVRGGGGGGGGVRRLRGWVYEFVTALPRICTAHHSHAYSHLRTQ